MISPPGGGGLVVGGGPHFKSRYYQLSDNSSGQTTDARSSINYYQLAGGVTVKHWVCNNATQSYSGEHHVPLHHVPVRFSVCNLEIFA